MNDMRAVIVPKSDQINADDLLGGPITITVREVAIRPGTEQPVSIFFDGDNNKPFKPCKSMARVMVHCWGPDANAYVGRSMTLYCDPKVKWGGMAVGGIRISHMSHVKDTMVMALTETKGSRKPFTVKPLVIEAPDTKLFDAASEAANAGVAAYQFFFKGLTKAQRETLLPRHDELKAVAKAVDDAATPLPTTEPVAETAASEPDPEAARAADFIAVINEKDTKPELDQFLNSTAFQRSMASWKKNKPDLFKLVDEAAAARIAEVSP